MRLRMRRAMAGMWLSSESVKRVARGTGASGEDGSGTSGEGSPAQAVLEIAQRRAFLNKCMANVQSAEYDARVAERGGPTLSPMTL